MDLNLQGIPYKILLIGFSKYILSSAQSKKEKKNDNIIAWKNIVSTQAIMVWEQGYLFPFQ